MRKRLAPSFRGPSAEEAKAATRVLRNRGSCETFTKFRDLSRIITESEGGCKGGGGATLMKPVGDSGFLMGDVEFDVGAELVGGGVSPSLQERPDGGGTGAHGLELAVNQLDQDHGVVAIEGGTSALQH